MFQREKPGSGYEYKISSDNTLEIKSTFSCYGLTISTELFTWYKLPQEKNDSKLNVISNYECIKTNGSIVLFENINSVISNNGYKTTIKPIDLLIKKKIKDSENVCCKIPGKNNSTVQLKTTNHLEKTVKIFCDSNVMINNNNLTRIVSGEQQNNRFDIYKANNETIIIDNMGRLSSKGTFEFSDNISSYIKNWHKKIDFVKASIDGKPPEILKISSRRRDLNRLVKVAYVKNNDSPRNISIKIASPELELTEKALYDKNLRENFKKTGYNVQNVRSDFRETGRHHYPKIEKYIRNIVSESFGNNSNTEILNEVEITFDDIYNKIGSKHIFDLLVIEFDNRKNISSIKTIEIKSSIGKANIAIVRDTVYECLHFEKKFKKNVTSIIFAYKNFKSNKSQNFAKQNDVILIDKTSCFKIEIGSLDLKSYVNLFESNKKNCNNFQNLRFNGLENNKSAGRDFEIEVKKLLENEGFNVVSNAIFYHNKQKIEIDLIARKDIEKVLISCRDAKDIYDKVSLKKTINKRANKVEHRKNLLKASSARVYVKTNSDLKESLKQLYEKISWTENVDIYII